MATEGIVEPDVKLNLTTIVLVPQPTIYLT